MRRLAFALVLLALPAAVHAHPAIALVRDARGNVFYSDLTHVYRLAPDGSKSIAVPNVHTHELYLDAAGNLYGEHLWYEGDATKKWGHRVWRRAPDGRITDVIPAREGFLSHYSFVRDSTGAMYWAESGEKRTIVRRRAADGTERDVARSFRDIRWIAARPDGTLYVIDDDRLVRVAPDGVMRELARGLAKRSASRVLVDRRHSVMGLFPDAQGNVYVARYGTGEVLRISDTGDITTVSRSTMPWSPSGVLVTPAGDLYVLEFSVDNRARVRKLRLATSSATPASSRAPAGTPRTSSLGSTAPTHRSRSHTSPSSAR
jgi:DNA-binding beta-propeller fold protein YncE